MGKKVMLVRFRYYVNGNLMLKYPAGTEYTFSLEIRPIKWISTENKITFIFCVILFITTIFSIYYYLYV